MAKDVVCVVGAGTAGLESLLAARARFGADLDLRLIAPEREFRYRPMTEASLFRPAAERGLAIADLVAETGATWVQDRVDAVHEQDGVVLTRDGDTVPFDYLLLSIGGHTRRPLHQGAVWERGRDPGVLDQIIAEILMDEIRTVAVNIPRGARWPLPGYELALVLAWRAANSAARVTLLTAEERPLGALGSVATAAVSAELDAAGVEVIAGVEVSDEAQPADAPTQPITLTLAGAGPPELAFDRLLSLPTVVAPFLAGVPTDDAGFIETDETLKVCGSPRVWAAGSCIAAELEHSALAAQQADAAIDAIAAAARRGAGGDGERSDPPGAGDLTGMILTGQRTRWLAENPPGIKQPSTRVLWWPPGRAVGRMLAQRIEAWDPAVHQQLPADAGGVAIRAPIALGCSDGSALREPGEVSPDVRAARLRDIENRQLMAVSRRERAADAELQALSAGLESLAARQQQVIRELQRQGYLHNRR